MVTVHGIQHHDFQRREDKIYCHAHEHVTIVYRSHSLLRLPPASHITLQVRDQFKGKYASSPIALDTESWHDTWKI